MNTYRTALAAGAAISLCASPLYAFAGSNAPTSSEPSRSARAQELSATLPDATLERALRPSDGPTVKQFSLTGEALTKARQRGSAARGVAARALRLNADRAMRQGQPTLTSDQDVISFELPDTTPVTLVVDHDDAIRGIAAQTTDLGSGLDLQIGFEAANSDNSTAGGGAGYEAGSPTGGMSRKAQGSRTLYWDPSYNSGVDHWVTTNFEKWQNTTKGQQRNWIYNRYATFDAANGNYGWRGEIVDATLRTRPWKGKESLVTGGPFAYTPRPSESCRDSATVSLNAGAYGGINIPLVNCYSGTEVYPNGSAHSMGVANYNSGTVAQRYMDFAFSFQTDAAATNPVMADYVFMEVEYCWGPVCLSPDKHQTVKWADPGW